MAITGPLVRRDGRNPVSLIGGNVAFAALVALAVVAVSVVGVWTFTHEPLHSAAPEAGRPLVIDLLSGTCLGLAVAAAWVNRTVRPGVAVGLAAAAAGAALPAWASWTAVTPSLRSALLAAPALAAVGLAQLVPRWRSSSDGSGPGIAALMARVAWTLAAAAVVVHLLAYDPFTDPSCSRVCRPSLAPVADLAGAGSVLRLEELLVLGVVIAGVAGVLAGNATPVRLRLAAGTSLLAVGVLTTSELVFRDTTVWARTTSEWLPWVLAPTVGVVCLDAYRTAARRRALDRLLEDLDGGRTKQVHFAVPGTHQWVDATGRLVPADVPGQIVLYDEHGPAVKLLIPALGDQDSAGAPARRLALSNARMTAITAARLEEVRSAQRRTVGRGDVERHRIERDLHDGAQQTLISAAFHLSAARARLGKVPELEHIQACLASALVRLRAVTRGQLPAVLIDEGLPAALEDLAAETGGSASVASQSRVAPPTDVTVAAYLWARAVTERAAPSTCDLDLHIDGAAVRVTVSADVDVTSFLPDEVADRVGALRGTVTSSHDARGWKMEVRLPCAS